MDGSTSEQRVIETNVIWFDQTDGSTLLEIVAYIDRNYGKPECTVEGCDHIPSRKRKDGRCQHCVRIGRTA